jgi:hypothetical protein
MLLGNTKDNENVILAPFVIPAEAGIQIKQVYWMPD